MVKESFKSFLSTSKMSTTLTSLKDLNFMSRDDLDPYVIFTSGTQVQKSSVASGQGPFANWNETFTFTVSDETPEVLSAKLFDKDSGTTDFFIGEAEIPLVLAILEGNIPPSAYSLMNDGLYKGDIWVSLSFKSEEN